MAGARNPILDHTSLLSTGFIMSIPARVHFCWIGTRLPWAYVFAILSAAERSELPELFLHHTDRLEVGPELAALRRAPKLQLIHVEPQTYLAEAGAALGIGDGLVAIYQKLASPVMRADVLRAAILYLEGGIYLDLDTITTKSLQPLLDTTQFVGTEIIVWPQAVRRSRSPIVLARHTTLDLLRKAIRNLPDGWEIFRHVEKFYTVAVNNAVMGAQAGAYLFADYLRAMLQVPLDAPPQAYALGPDLLQEVVDRYRGSDLTVHAPRLFYPLPPEISSQWFRSGRAPRLDAVLSAETRVVHWYASVRTKSHVAQIDPAYVRAHRSHQLYSALVCACIEDLPVPGAY
jgi:hypothetical protein